MLLRWLEDICDLCAHRIAAGQATEHRLSEVQFASFVASLIKTRRLSVRSGDRDRRQIVLIAPGKIFGNMQRITPKLRYRLRLQEDGRVAMEVFEYLFCRHKDSPQARVVRQLCQQQLGELLQLADAAVAPPPPEHQPQPRSQDSVTL